MSLAGVIRLQQMESNIEITIFFFLFGKGISIRGKAWKAHRIDQLYKEAGRGKVEGVAVGAR